MTDNKKIWDSLKRPPADALKTIKAGRLKGKSDINPQWRYEVMTEAFGVCGVGWKFEIVDHWIDEGSYEQKVQNVKVLLCVLYEKTWSEPIPGVGGSMLIAKESGGLHTNDEAMKMAVTDALSTAMKMLGVASDIYRGAFDGSKYHDAKPEKPAEKKKTYLTPKFLKLMAGYKVEIGEEDYYKILKTHGYDHANEIAPANQEGALKVFAKKLEKIVEKREHEEVSEKW